MKFSTILSQWRGVFALIEMKGAIRLLSVVGMAATLIGCRTVGFNYVEPAAALPDTWTQSVEPHLEGDASSLANWWEGFGDKTLNALIARAHRDNPDFEIAIQRVVEVRAQRKVAQSALFPNLDHEAGYARERRSDNARPFEGPNPLDLYSAGVGSSWEIDVFGGLRRGVEAAEAEETARIEQYRDLLVTLFADVALNYLDYRTLEERLWVARKNIEIQQSSLDLAQERLDAGLAAKLDVTQARSNLETTRALVPQLEGELARVKNRIATLVGAYPNGVASLLEQGHRHIPLPSRSYRNGLPADLLRTRPDVRAAERTLAKEVAEIGVAESDLYPKFALNGALSLRALDVSDVVDAGSAAYSFGPSLRWNLFSSGEIKNEIRQEEAQARQAYAAYEKVILLAVEEVETSLAGVATERRRLAALRRAVTAGKESVQLVKGNYQAGNVDFQRVIDSERELFRNQDLAVISKGQVAKNYVSLYRALGGGAALAEIELPEPSEKPGGGWLKKRPLPYPVDAQSHAQTTPPH